MSVKPSKSKGRNTRNSQRLYNLQQQENLYKKLGISAMASKQKQIREDEESGEKSPSETEMAGDEEDPPNEEETAAKKVQPKKGKPVKRTHSMSSNSDSDREKPVIKKKKKKKSLQGGQKSQLVSGPFDQRVRTKSGTASFPSQCYEPVG